MKLFRYGDENSEKPGLLDHRGHMRDLSKVILDLTPEYLGKEALDRLRKIDVSTLPVIEPTRLAVPVAGVRQCIAIGLNYVEHAAASHREIPKEPIVFFKSISALSGPDDDIVLPGESNETDWEIELAIVIGKQVKYVRPAEALDYVAGYCIANDLSERAWQRRSNGAKGKSFETFLPLGPWLVTSDEVNPQDLNLSLSVNGIVKQNSSTNDMIFGCAQLISHISEFMTLLPGDVILTGTPWGVGAGRTPAEHLRAGDFLELSITGLGRQAQKVRHSLGE